MASVLRSALSRVAFTSSRRGLAFTGYRCQSTAKPANETVRPSASNPRVHEEVVGGVKQRFNYRSELVDSWKLDRSHRNIWVSFAFIIIIGFTAFVYVKGTVIEGRKEEMMERDRMRREMKLSGADRRKISLVAD
ncbi:hypothetical protein QR680_003343 [Steinernema hermaphroditum]|uniref:Uncharacterized protein n=1 Tax=Steinernema hermaphroditum TaxID=289476 RepID=A0AA39H882_9BILA|nr:hypothetical protein QR680_003343 [Steinernema hermaphroditum]